MTGKPLSPVTVSVLDAIMAGAKYGFDIMDRTGLPSGTVYPVLSRLERDALVRGRWEAKVVAQRGRRPPRRYYVVSASGMKALAHSVEYYRTLAGGVLPTGVLKPARG